MKRKKVSKQYRLFVAVSLALIALGAVICGMFYLKKIRLAFFAKGSTGKLFSFQNFGRPEKTAKTNAFEVIGKIPKNVFVNPLICQNKNRKFVILDTDFFQYNNGSFNQIKGVGFDGFPTDCADTDNNGSDEAIFRFIGRLILVEVNEEKNLLPRIVWDWDKVGLNEGQITDAKLYDIDGDGKRDILALTDRVRIFKNQGGGAFVLIDEFFFPDSTLGPSRFMVDDFDGDSKSEIVLAGARDDSEKGSIYFFKKINNIFNLISEFVMPVVNNYYLAKTDINNDGKIEIANIGNSVLNGPWVYAVVALEPDKSIKEISQGKIEGGGFSVEIAGSSVYSKRNWKRGNKSFFVHNGDLYQLSCDDGKQILSDRCFSRKVYSLSSYNHALALGDIDNDGEDEIFAAKDDQVFVLKAF